MKWQGADPERLLSTLRTWPRQSGDARAIVISIGSGRDLRREIDLLDAIRGDLRLPWPIVLIIFESLGRYPEFGESLVGNPPNPSSGPIVLSGGESVLRLDPATYCLRAPFRLATLEEALLSARLLDEEEIEKAAGVHAWKRQLALDREFRHRCVNVTSAVRLLQGAFQCGDLNQKSYVSVLNTLRTLPDLSQTVRVAFQAYLQDLKSIPPLVVKSATDREKPGQPAWRILLVDDEAESSGCHQVLVAVLGPQGFAVESQADRTAFRQQVEREEVQADTILLDLMMPDKPEDSIRLIHRIRARFPALPVIIFTALNDVPLFRRCQEAGAFDYFVKELGAHDRDPVAYYQKLLEVLGRAVGLSARKGPAPPRARRGLHFEPDIGETATVRFAFRASAASCLDPSEQARALAGLREFEQHVVGWFGQPAQRLETLELRISCDPLQERVDLSLTGNAVGADASEAKGKAEVCGNELESLLRLDSVHEFERVESDEQFIALSSPFRPRSVIEIRRAPLSLALKSGRQYTGLWHPLQGGSAPTMEAFLKLMLHQSDPTILSLCFGRLHVEKRRPELIRVGEDQLSELKRILAAWPTGVGFLSDSRQQGPAPDVSAVTLDPIVGYLMDAVSQLRQGRGFWAKVWLLSASDAIPSTLVSAFVSTFFGPGPYHVRRLQGADVVETAWERIRRLEMFDSNEIARLDAGDLLRDYYPVSEAAHLFRLPLPTDRGVPGMREKRLRLIPVSRAVREASPSPGRFLMAEGFPEQSQEPIPFSMKLEDLRTHLYVCGKTGTGKSTLLLRLAVSILEQGMGLCLIDPHGDLVESLVPRIPRHRARDVVLFDPARDTAVGLNLLEHDGSQGEQDFIVQEFISMMFKLFDPETMGPMFERGLRNALRLLMAARETLAEAGRIFRDQEFRSFCLTCLDPRVPGDKEVQAFWDQELKNWPEDERHRFITWVVSKLDRFIADSTLRRIVSRKKSSFDLPALVEGNGVLLAAIPKGMLGEVSSSLLGMILAAKIQLAALKRARIPPDQRKDFCFVIDEFQSFVSSAGGFSYAEAEGTFSTLLSEARKYRISLVLANQYISQLDRGVRQAVFGNTGSQIAFRVSIEDAAYLAGQFPGLAVSDFQTCPNFHAYARPLIDGVPHPPFTIRTIPPASIPAAPETVREIRSGKASRFVLR